MSINIQKDVILAPFTTMRVGGPARFFVSVKSIEEAEEAVVWAREQGLAVFILGGGSNMLVRDEGFPGLVIKIDIKGITYEDTPGGIRVLAGAGG